jgi:hypothetical protein
MRFMIIVKTKNFEVGVMPERPQSNSLRRTVVV